jgi:hypothetical protein
LHHASSAARFSGRSIPKPESQVTRRASRLKAFVDRPRTGQVIREAAIAGTFDARFERM